MLNFRGSGRFGGGKNLLSVGMMKIDREVRGF